VKIYATDIDDGALLAARRGYFPAKQVASVPGHLLQKYIVKVEGWYCFRKELRRNVFFGRHDLLQIGRAESLLAHRATFRPVDLRRRVFAKLPSANLNTQLHLAVESPVIGR